VNENAVSWLEWLALAGLVLLNAFFSAAGVAIAAVAGRTEVHEQMEHDPGLTARLLLRLGENSTRLLATVRLGTMLAGYLAAVSLALTLVPTAAGWFSRPPLLLSAAASTGWAVFLTTLLLACAMLFLGELLPKALADYHPRAVALVVAWPMQLLTWLLFPLTRALTGLSILLVDSLGGRRTGMLPYVREEEILTMVDAGEESGAIEPVEKEMISGILEMGKTLVREVMVPRTDIVALEVGTPLPQAVEPILQAGHTRIPVYEETIDNIIGVLHAKDLLRHLRDCQHEQPIRGLLRPAHFVPETKIVDDLLRELQQQRTHMAIVVDEYGGTAGLVTIEDLLEEIVGEIQDEYDTEEPLLKDLGGGEYLCDARLSVDDAEEELGLTIPSGDYDTLGGFIYERLGAIPEEGDHVVVGDATITVVEVEGVRPIKLRIRLQAQSSGPAGPDSRKETSPDEDRR
jgi:CBS domain containing-hemolysin-like protein